MAMPVTTSTFPLVIGCACEIFVLEPASACATNCLRIAATGHNNAGGHGVKLSCAGSHPLLFATSALFFAGISINFCYHHLIFLLEPQIFFLLPPSLDFAGNSHLFCYHWLCVLLELPHFFCYNRVGFVPELAFFGTTVVDFCYNRQIFLLRSIHGELRPSQR
ncbi:hypothetical protein VPH35_112333 [Triticum aestivum]